MTTELDKEHKPYVLFEIEIEARDEQPFFGRAFAIFYDREERQHKSILLGDVPPDWQTKLMLQFGGEWKDALEEHANAS